MKTKTKLQFAKTALVLIGFLFIVAVSPKAYATPIEETKLIELANQERIERGLKPLVIDLSLYFAASMKAEDMLENGYFEHFSPDGKSPWDFIKKTRYSYAKAGENLAMDFRTSEGAHKAWMPSPTHKENILDPNYENIAISAVNGSFLGKETTIVVQMFGKKSASASQIDAFIQKITSFLLGI